MRRVEAPTDKQQHRLHYTRNIMPSVYTGQHVSAAAAAAADI